MGGMRDCRYKKTEEKLLSVFFDARYDTMGQIAKRAGVARSTVYTHHHSVMKILPDWEEYILTEYRLLIEKKIQIKSVRFLYFEMLTFILKNRKFFEIFLRFGDREIVMKMVFSMRVVEKSEKVFRVYVSEVVELIFAWGERGFSEKELEKVLSDAVYLTQTAWDRLGKLDK